MARYKRYNYKQRVMIPVSLEEQLIPGTLEFAIHTLVEDHMNMTIFDERYNNDETGRWAYDPRILLKVVLFAYSRGLITSRKIERVCRENVLFMALSCGQQPDHSTIAAFVSSMKDEVLSLFRDVLLVCEAEGLLEGSFFALDGCKLSSNASKQWSGTIADLQHKKEKIEQKVEALLSEQIEIDRRDGTDIQGAGFLKGSDREKRIEELRKKAERIGRWLSENGAKIGKRGKEIKSNITDNESASMISSHGVIQGYNGQAMVDRKHQVIVSAEAFGDSQDYDHVSPLVDGAKENMKSLGHSADYFEEKVLTADSNYHSEGNLKKCVEEKLDAYIPDNRFRGRDPRFQDRQDKKGKRDDRFTLADFQYDEKADEYICPNGRALKCNVKKGVSNGVIFRRYRMSKDGCVDCDKKVKCIRQKNGKRKSITVPIGNVPGNLTKAMQEKVDSEQGRRIYPQRIAIVEPVFANIRVNKRADRFTLRGKIKVNIQWLLYCMVHNMEKILNYGLTHVPT